jgi:large subunit ribosomal protein L35
MKNKLKTHKATVKRFKLTASGKLKHYHQGNNHLKAGKNALQKKRKRGVGFLKSKRQIRNLTSVMGL